MGGGWKWECECYTKRDTKRNTERERLEAANNKNTNRVDGVHQTLCHCLRSITAVGFDCKPDRHRAEHLNILKCFFFQPPSEQYHYKG